MAVQETPYRRQVATRAGAAMPLASAESFGAGLGRQMAATGQALHRERLEDHAIERRNTANGEWAKFNRDFAAYRENMGGISREARKDGSTGHAMRMGEAYEAGRAALLDSITEEEVRERAAAQFDEFGARFRVGEADFEEVRRVETLVTDTADGQAIRFNRTRRLEGANDYVTELQLGLDYIDGLEVPESVKGKLRREEIDGQAVAYLQGMIDRDPAAARAMMDSDAGLFDAVDPSKLEALRSAADVEVRRTAAEGEQAAVIAGQAFTQDLRLAREAHEQGIDIAGQLPDLIQRAQALGRPDIALELDGIQAEVGFARQYETATPLQMEQRAGALRTKGDGRTPGEDRELAWIDRTQPGRTTRYNRNPADHHARSEVGGAMPAIDWAQPTPQMLGDRSRWAAARNIAPFTSTEVRALGERWSSGKMADRRAVTDLLAALPDEQAIAAARQVDDDPRLAVVVTLPPMSRALALRGNDALKANSRLISGALGEDDRLSTTVEEYDRRFREALRAVPPGQRDAILDTARFMMAGKMDESGQALSADLYWSAVNTALGATGAGEARKGGLGRWGEKWFVLPDGVSGEAFGAAAQRAAQDAGVALARSWPVAVGNGQYEFHGAGGAVVRTQEGAPWRVRVRPQ